MSIQFPNLGINLGYVGKSIQIFGFEITFFGLVIALGMLLGMGFVILEAKRCGENKDDYLEMMIMSLLLGVVGSRMLYVLCSWNHVHKQMLFRYRLPEHLRHLHLQKLSPV